MPLLGGYFFVRRFILARYAVAHDESTKVYYRAALAGCLLAAAAALLHNALEPEWADYAAVARDARIHVLGPLLEKPDAAASAASAGEQQRREAGAKLRALIAMVCVWAFVLGLTAPVCNAVARLLLWLAHLPILLLQKGLLWLGWAPRGPRISPIERLNRRAITDDLERMLYEAMVHGELIQVTLDNHKVYVGIVRGVDPVGPVLMGPGACRCSALGHSRS